MTKRLGLWRALAVMLLVVALPLGANARAESEEQQLVDKARLTVQAMKQAGDADVMRTYIQRAKAVVVIPAFVKASFIVGGAYGNAVIVGKNPATGQFNSPAFASLTEGSIGLQAGAESSQIIMTVLSDKALESLLTTKFTLGAEAGLTVLMYGAKRETATTTNLDVDIMTFTRSQGMSGGMSLDGAVLSVAEKSNIAYYGQTIPVRDIVIHGKAWSDGASVLREELDTF